MFISHEQVAVSTAVLTVADLTVPAEATRATLQATGANNIRYTMDNASAPSTTVGMMLITGGESVDFLIADVRRIKFIRDGAADTTLDVHYSGRE